MPELVEVEAWRTAMERTVGRTIDALDAPDAWYLKGGIDADTLSGTLVGATVVAVDRRGKLLRVHTDGAVVLGLRFGMTGRLFVDDHDPVGPLEYGPDGEQESWRRLTVRFADGTSARVVDPRRLGGVFLDPDVSGLGPDAATLTRGQLADALRGRRAPVKAVLMDQARVAGLGNLLCDETLWRARLDPWSAAQDVVAVDRLARAVRDTVADLTARGGSHTGDLQAHRHPGGLCPRCGSPLRRDRVGGRTTYWCPEEQQGAADGRGSTTVAEVHG